MPVSLLAMPSLSIAFARDMIGASVLDLEKDIFGCSVCSRAPPASGVMSGSLVVGGRLYGLPITLSAEIDWPPQKITMSDLSNLRRGRREPSRAMQLGVVGLSLQGLASRQRYDSTPGLFSRSPTSLGSVVGTRASCRLRIVPDWASRRRVPQLPLPLDAAGRGLGQSSTSDHPPRCSAYLEL